MTYNTADARQEMLDAIGDAADHLGAAIGQLGIAYELLDDATADTLEEQLFRPIQSAYGLARRTHDGFAERFVLDGRAFAPAAPSETSHRSVRQLVDHAVDEVSHADAALTELQDSMRPVEVGDAELRAGLAEVRTQVGDIRGRARALLSRLGR
jgi:hypothetical protein